MRAWHPPPNSDWFCEGGCHLRISRSVNASDHRIAVLVQAGNFAALREMGFVYIVLPADGRVEGLPAVYSDAEVCIQELR
jgi:hypothetical protein